jgi:hypothetical protein
LLKIFYASSSVAKNSGQSEAETEWLNRVSNSIILVDFIRLRLDQGMPLREAIVDAGAVRFVRWR